MADEKSMEFNALHRDADGTLLTAGQVLGTSHYVGDGYFIQLPKLDMRSGDTITLSPKPVRPALPLPEFAEVGADQIGEQDGS